MLGFVMFDVVNGKVANATKVLGCAHPEKRYKDHVDHYGDIRSFWLPIASQL